VNQSGFKVCLQYSVKSSHVVESGNLWAVVNKLHERAGKGKPEITISANDVVWMLAHPKAEKMETDARARRLLKDAVAFGFIELVYPRTRPLSYRWIGTVANGEILPNMEAWHRECAKTVAKIAQERRLQRVKDKYKRLARHTRCLREIEEMFDSRGQPLPPTREVTENAHHEK
jgi:hypothetical protein